MASPPHPPGSRQGRGQRHPLERMALLLASLVDVHLRMALQEVGRDRRRLVGGMVLLGMGLGLLATSFLLASGALVVWLVRGLGWGLVPALLAMGVLDLALAGIALRVAGVLLQGPYLVKTRAGLVKATRLIAGR
ncbi:MAG: phage holin family protein [Synechococcus sp. SB0668_bin_15]|nr:phage holin family protein [Synechococcus sp. SB0668_bin_15]MXZ82741.1 phage holin family protein [Synechococcus sp. SB0666_bin_14]MYC49742.1 phage holin family protein [Synechococcus sp. SB0662_bin_14]MYG47095.1 phage holin family protein [Synechococcus sp. SB0675_bin_6]MYJ59005.1 phage holin family protein [Synechococcus sp. SB0672_bin_6]MYK91957.1 phage holin family protein [Synechococcus sp. SB0669_bin_8]